MADAAITTEGAPPPRRLRPDWKWRLLNELFAAFVALLFLLAAGLVLLDTAPGHRFIIDRIQRLETASGLKIRIGRIDGSIFGKSQLKNVAVSDQRGVFLTSPNIKLDWAPGAWLYNKLSIDNLTAAVFMMNGATSFVESGGGARLRQWLERLFARRG